jgi:hypothetical protein
MGRHPADSSISGLSGNESDQRGLTTKKQGSYQFDTTLAYYYEKIFLNYLI